LAIEQERENKMINRFGTDRETPLLPAYAGVVEFARVLGRSHRPWARLAIVAMGLSLGLAASQSTLLAQRTLKDEPKSTDTTDDRAALPVGGANVDPHAYRIGPEDLLSIKVWREPDLSGMFTVRPDGKITLPLSGELTAGGLTPVELTKVVKEAYSKIVNSPEIILQVDAVRSKKYFLVGEVNRTGAFPLAVPTTILEAINSAGGLREFANQKNIVILRGGKPLKFNYKDVIRGKNLEQNILLENGDHIVVR
jgi:polysaccharide export outer membrane protein